MRWISVEDRLPVDGQCVDVFFKSKYKINGDRLPDVWFINDGFFIPESRKATVTHWMPLPNPPELEKEDE